MKMAWALKLTIMIVEYPEHLIQMDQFLSWQQAYEAGPEICGGKGYNLARLSRYGFRIPRGGVLPINAPISQIEAGLERLGLTDAEVAVRSSATGEDSANASFAGIHQSFLRVKGAPAVREKAQKCIASLQTPEAVAYRKRMGIADRDVRCAVVLCEMVNARFAGVAFSVDPLTGRRDRIVIEAVKGLGDALVSGKVSGERITWLNRGGMFHTADLHVIERLTRYAGNRLLYEVTVEDPEVLTQPWVRRKVLFLNLNPDANISELPPCSERDADHIKLNLR